MRIYFKTFDELKTKTTILFREMDRYAKEYRILLSSNGVAFKDLGDYRIALEETPENFRKFETLQKDRDFAARLEWLQTLVGNLKRECGLVEAQKTDTPEEVPTTKTKRAKK